MEHSKAELKMMANRLLVAKSEKDDRYLEFCFTMMIKTGTPIEVVEQKIVEFSEL